MQKILGRIGVCFALMSWILLASASPVLIALPKVTRHAHDWHLSFPLSASAQYHTFMLHHPERYVVDIEHATLKQPITQRYFINTPIKQVRYSHNQQRLRLVFDLEYPVNASARVVANHLKTQSDWHLVVRLLGHRQKVLAFDWPFQHAVKPVMQAIESNTKTLRKVVIVVDPGHGGKDPGATGPRGTHEKNVVLHIARDLQHIINQQPGFSAVLTRTGDYYIPLRGRLARARYYRADMFISIHADAYRNRQAHGASVYALSQRGATSEAARWLATRENESELMGGVKLTDKNNILKSVLINLSQTATIRASLHIGQALLGALHHIATLHHPEIEQAAFVVLKSPDIPSLLVESGFISNAHEEYRLNNSHYQHLIAEALMQGIKNYFVHRPPRNTYLAYWRSHPRLRPKKYVVVAGDTLTGIASRYQISTVALRRLNRLHHNRLFVGQVLEIPTG